MNITKCANNHYYDLDKYDQCPFCASVLDTVKEEKTIAYDVKDYYERKPEDNQLTLGYSENVSADSKTIRVSFLHQKVNPVAGWIVCVNGLLKGKFYTFYSGKNFIGRSRAMDVAIINDESIETEKHCCITYDPKGIKFFITAVNGAVQVNGEAVTGSVQIHNNDLIKLGQTEFRFVQYCNEERNWNE